jgi:tetratricopeptide (TPR) repeat protein
MNPFLKIDNLKPETILKTFSANRKDGFYLNTRVYRPIPSLSLALNWYFGQHNVFGYHLVNTLVHFLTAFILFLTLLSLLKSPALKSKYEGSEYFIALLAAAFWALNPIQTQAITYIVQRMAAMAAMFYILGIYFYVKGRLNRSRSKQVGFFTGCFLSYVCALASKENAATLPVAIILLEVIFFQDLKQPQTRKRVFWVAAGTGLGIVLLGSLFYLQGDPLSILRTYNERFFSPLQRLMTEPRILVYYLSLIFYPVPTRLSIEHDVVISTSLFHPWTTLPSILLLFGLIGFGVFQIRKRPVLSFSILFFILNHLIESTIIGLELIFEHRNYLPSLFLFFPVAAALKFLLDYYHRQKSHMHMIIVSFLVFVLIGLGTGTYIRNFAWATEKTLWEDAMMKAPGMNRPYHNLAWSYYSIIGEYDKALELYEKSFQLKMHAHHGKASTINNVGNIYFMKGELNKASRLFEEAHRLYPNYKLYQLNLAKVKAESGEWEAALVILDKILSKDPMHRQVLSLKSQILLKQKRVEEAVDNFLILFRLNPNDPFVMWNIGIGYRLIENLDRAEWFLKAANRIDPNDISILFWLIETNLKTEDKIEANRYLEKLNALGPMASLLSEINKLNDENLMPLASRKMLLQKIAANLKEKLQKLENLEKHSI